MTHINPLTLTRFNENTTIISPLSRYCTVHLLPSCHRETFRLSTLDLIQQNKQSYLHLPLGFIGWSNSSLPSSGMKPHFPALVWSRTSVLQSSMHFLPECLGGAATGIAITTLDARPSSPNPPNSPNPLCPMISGCIIYMSQTNYMMVGGMATPRITCH